ncbi:MAG: hypothetical protein Q4G68_07880 [Planctomycetia bacterium]|nr:hypothetical protein [Planctomycetia bacterium]
MFKIKRRLCLTAAILCFGMFCADSVLSQEALNLGDQRELFIDDYLIGAMENVCLQVHEPNRENLVAVLDKPWEGNGCIYTTVLYDEEAKLYRLYMSTWKVGNPTAQITMLTSPDGINWTRPNLGLWDYEGVKDNNIVVGRLEWPGGKSDSPENFSPCLDTNPNATPDAKYKATGSGMRCNEGVWAYKSPDAVHWSPMHNGPVYASGHFDSQNVSFWSEKEQKYILYYRVKIPCGDGTENFVRCVFRATSDDYINWKNEGQIQFPEEEGPNFHAQFYVNQIRPYYRAKQLYIGFPARYCDNGLTESTKQLPSWEERQARMSQEVRFATAVTDTVFITSRDGINFRQGNDVFLRPGLRTKDNWAYGDNYLAWNLVETDSTEEDSPRELSLYASESYFTGNDTSIRRYSLRIDGFCSIHAKRQPGTVVTKPLTFSGKELTLNYRTSAAGLVYVEICDASGNVIPGFEKENCDVLYGDSLDRIVSWKGSKDVSSLAGKTITLKFYMQEADVYSLKFNQ